MDKLLDHSLAKIALYRRYLSVYLNIILRVPTVDHIYLFDLFCGEGKDREGNCGSPLVAIEVIQNYLNDNGGICKPITIWLNDNGKSEIEPHLYKIGRVEKLVKDLNLSPSIPVEYYKRDFQDIFPIALDFMRGKRKSRGLFFIDPCGYKDIDYSDLKKLMSFKNSEILLFIPAQFMYRFADCANNLNIEPLRAFLTTIFPGRIPDFVSGKDFIYKVKSAIKDDFFQEKVYVSSYTIQRDPSNIYCLFFFTSNVKGFEKFIEAKWEEDTNSGSGYTFNTGLTFLNELDFADFKEQLESFIHTATYKTNKDIYFYGIESEFKVKHINSILREWQQTRNDFRTSFFDGKPVQKNAFYIDSNPNKKIKIWFEK